LGGLPISSTSFSIVSAELLRALCYLTLKASDQYHRCKDIGESVLRKIISFAAALMLSACSTNYGMYSKGDERHSEYGYVSTYLAIAATVLIVGGASGGGSSSGGGSGGSGY
jgi:hypothetical protein